MSISSSIFRATKYYSRYGPGATIQRLGLELKRVLFLKHMVVFYCDLSKLTTSPAKIPSPLKVERLTSYAELALQDLQEMAALQTRRDIQERFEKGACLWLIRSGDMLASYSWTIRGRTITPYYFPLAQDDVQLFDFYTFPKFRGRAILWFLITHVLHSLKAEGAVRVFGHVAEWNQPSLSFYKMTPFRRLGLARSYEIFGHTCTRWVEGETAQRVQKETERKDTEVTVARAV